MRTSSAKPGSEKVKLLIDTNVFGKSHGLLVPDAVIAATASILNARLVTRNAKHFPMKDLDLLVPF